MSLNVLLNEHKTCEIRRSEMTDSIVLKDLWSEFCKKHCTEMYESKICYTIKEGDADHIRVTFKDGQGYELLYNFLQTKKIINRGYKNGNNQRY